MRWRKDRKEQDPYGLYDQIPFTSFATAVLQRSVVVDCGECASAATDEDCASSGTAVAAEPSHECDSGWQRSDVHHHVRAAGGGIRG